MSVKGINTLTFNHDQTYFSCCTETGVRIFEILPLSQVARFDLGGVRKCEVLNPFNCIAIISGGKNGKYCQNTVMIYDSALEKFVMEIVCDSGARSVLMRREKLIIVNMDQISVFAFPTAITHLIDLETRVNPKGLCVITPLETSRKQIIAYPGDTIGSIHIMDIGVNFDPVYSVLPSVKLDAHHGEISCLAINHHGTRIASASATGTLIKIWDTCRQVKVAELRRGSDTAQLCCINFSPNSKFLCCSSDKGTVHIFGFLESDFSSGISPFSPYCSSQCPLVTFTLPSEVGSICTFLTPESIVAICPDGISHTYRFTKYGASQHTSLQVYLFDLL